MTIAHDASGTIGPTGSLGLAIPHTCTGSDRILVVGFTLSRYSNTVAGHTVTCSYAGVPMTDAVSGTTTATVLSASSTSSGLVLFYLLNPASGTNDIVYSVNVGGGAMDNLLATRSSYTGVSGISGVTTATNNAQANSPTNTITSQVGDQVFCVASHGDTITGVGTGTTQRAILNNTASAAGDNIICGDEPGAASVGIDFTSAATDQWVMIGLNMVAAGGAAPVNEATPLPTLGPPWMSALHFHLWRGVDDIVTNDVIVSSYCGIGVATASDASVDATATASAAIGALARSAPTVDVSTPAAAYVGAHARSGGALAEFTVGGRTYIGVLPTSQATASSDATVVGLALVGVVARSGGATAELPTSSRAHIGAVLRGDGALVEATMLGRAYVGVVARAGGALAEATMLGRAYVGALLRSGGAALDATAPGVALVGVVLRSSGNTIDASATGRALVGVQPSAGGALAALTVVGQAKVGAWLTSLPQAVTDATVNGRALVGVRTYGLPTIEPNAAGTARVGAALRSSGNTIDATAAGTAYLGARLNGLPTITTTASGLAIVGARLHGLPTITISASGTVYVGAAPNSQPTYEAIIGGRLYVGVYGYSLLTLPDGPLVLGPVIVWAEPGMLEWAEPVGITWAEPTMIGGL